MVALGVATSSDFESATSATSFSLFFELLLLGSASIGSGGGGIFSPGFRIFVCSALLSTTY